MMRFSGVLKSAALAILAGAGAAHAQTAPLAYCGVEAKPEQKISPICADAKLVAIEKQQATAFAAALKRLEAQPKLHEALRADEARFLRQRDAILRNHAKLPDGDSEKGEKAYDPALLMQERIAFLGLIDGKPRTTLEGWWGGAEGYAGIWQREVDPFETTMSLYGDRALKKISGMKWLCWGMGSTPKPKFDMKSASLEARVVKGDGEDLKSQDVRLERRDGMLFAKGLPLKPANKKGDGSPFCPEGAKLQDHVPMFPLTSQPRL